MADKRSHLYYGEAPKAKQEESLLGDGAQTLVVAEEFDEAIAKRQAFEAAKAKISKNVNQKYTLQLPTDDAQVREKLREYGDPITLFGEGKGERRERLRSLMTGKKALERFRRKEEEEGRELFFTVGSMVLKDARRKICTFSLTHAAERLKKEREHPMNSNEVQWETETEEIMSWVQSSMSTELSQVGDERPLTQGKFSPDGKVFATSGWTGHLKLWSVPDGEQIKTMYSTTESMCHGMAFHPNWKNGSLIATGMANGQIYLWDTEKEPEKEEATRPIFTLGKHDDRVNRVVFHPTGNHLVSTSHDRTWRLWDLQTQKELLAQEGHSSAVYGVAMHPDGSLLCTTDLGGVARIWDLRIGRSVIPLQGHSHQILTCDFNPWGNTIATGSDDNTIKIWDLRKRKNVSTMLAHSKSISCVQFDKTGRFILSSGYDKLLKIWSSVNHQCKKVLVGHEGKVMGADSTCIDGQYWIGSVASDRTLKFWGTFGSPNSMNVE